MPKNLGGYNDALDENLSYIQTCLAFLANFCFQKS